MRSLIACIAAVVLVFAVSTSGDAAETAGTKNVTFSIVSAVTMTATVTDIDHQSRKVQLTDAENKVRTVPVSDAVKNLNQVRRGDTVTVEAQEIIDVEVLQGPGETMNIGSESQTSALPGQKPSGVRTIEGKLKTMVESIDYQARTITFKNRKGVLATYKIGKEVTRFNDIKPKDMLVIEYKQVKALSVK